MVATIAECPPRGLTQFSVNMRVLKRAITTQGQEADKSIGGFSLSGYEGYLE